MSSTRLQQNTRRIHGTEERPRLSVSVSNKNVIAQIINDDTAQTLAYSISPRGKKDISLTEKAEKVGADIAKKAKAAKITHVVFDRGGKQYHGRIKALADAARSNGLEF